MKTVQGIILGFSVLASSAALAQEFPAELFMTADDEAAFTVSKTQLVDGTFEFDTVVHTPELLDLNWIFCDVDFCRFEYTLKTNGPVDFTGYNVTRNTPYGYAGITSPDIAIDFNIWGNTEITIQNAFTEVSTDPLVHAEFVDISRGNSLVSITGVDGDFVTVSGFFEIFEQLPGVVTQYQTFQIVASGIQWSPLRLLSNFFPTTDYFSGDANKGTVTRSYDPIARAQEWVIDGWNTGTGHYAAVRYFTNGDSQTDNGKDLSGYNILTVELACTDGMVVEAFMGSSSFDSAQAFLQDISCDGNFATYTWDISGVNRSDIQTGFWMHIPTWKNTGLGQAETLNVDVKQVIFSEQ